MAARARIAAGSSKAAAGRGRAALQGCAPVGAGAPGTLPRGAARCSHREQQLSETFCVLKNASRDLDGEGAVGFGERLLGYVV